MKNLIILISILITNFTFGQSPNCNYNIVLSQVETNKYEYRIFLEDQGFEKRTFEYYNQDFTDLGFPNNSSLFELDNGKKVLLATFDTHCYPNEKNILWVVVYRKNKKTNEIELMYTEKPVEESYTEIIFKNFKVGKQKAKINRYVTLLER